MTGGSTGRAALLDFGGVVATEGFRRGLAAIARLNGLDPDELHRKASNLVYETGYVTGECTENEFWSRLREDAGVLGTDEELRREILERFRVRPALIAAVGELRAEGVLTAILSDQTDWLDELDARDGFSASFDRVFNSYHMGKGKRDPTVFDDVLGEMGISPGNAVFVDDDPGNVDRAASRRLQAVLFRDEEGALRVLEELRHTPR